MKNVRLVLILLLFVNPLSQAQSLGGIDVRAHYGFMLPPLNIENFKTGLGISFFHSKNKFITGLDVYFAKMSIQDDLVEKQSRISVPVHGGLSFGEKVQFSIEIGPLISFYINDSFNNDLESKPVNFGFIALSMCKINIGNKWGLSLRYEFTVGEDSYYSFIRDIKVTENQVTLFISAGIFYRIR